MRATQHEANKGYFRDARQQIVTNPGCPGQLLNSNRLILVPLTIAFPLLLSYDYAREKTMQKDVVRPTELYECVGEGVVTALLWFIF